MTTVTETPARQAVRTPTFNVRSNSLWRLTFRRFFRQRSALVGLIMLGVLVFMAIFAEWLAPYDPLTVFAGAKPVCFQSGAQECGEKYFPDDYSASRDSFDACVAGGDGKEEMVACAQQNFPSFDEALGRRFDRCMVGSAARCDEEYIEENRGVPCIYLLGCPQQVPHPDDPEQIVENPQHIMGLDGNTRDMFSRILYGARLSLVIGFATISFAIIVGTILGAIAGYVGGWPDVIIMRVMDVLLAFPSLLLAIAIVAVLGKGLINALLAIGIVSIPAYARLVRASVLTIRETEYVEASKALGASPLHILFQRILPNALTPLIVQGTLGIATAILDTAALSFLGFGAQPPTPEWGSMLGLEYERLFTHPHLVVFPGIMITLTVLSFNLIGDGLRDALDPRLAQTEAKGAVRT